MAKILDKINKIRTATLGKEVRGALADGLEAVNTEVENTTTDQTNLKKEFDTLIDTAGNSLGDLNSSITESTELKKQLDEWNNSNQDILGMDERITGNTSGILSNANEIADIILALAECIKKDGSAKIADFLDFGETGTNKLTGIRNNRGCEMLFQNQIQLRNTNATETVNNFAVVFGGDGVYPGESSTGKLNLGAPSRPWKDVWVGSVNSHVLKGELTLTNGYKLKWIRYRTNNIINANVSHAEWATFNSPFSSEISTFGANCHYNLTEASRNIQGVVVNAHASDDKDALLIVIDGLSTIRGGCIYEILCWGIGR